MPTGQRSHLPEDRQLEIAWWRRMERRWVILVAAHSLGVGLALLFLPDWGTRLGGWGEVVPLFFARQAGALHLVLAAGYLREHLRYGGIGLLLLAKTVSVAFLFGVTLAEGAPGVVPLAGLADGLMALTAWWLRRKIERESRR